MKRLFLLSILVFFVVGCNKKYSKTDEGFGSLKISAITDRSVISIQSRAANLDPETYFLTLQSEQGRTVYSGQFPKGGTIPNLPAGTYTGRLSSEATAFSKPAFDAPFYTATVNNIVITSGGTTHVDFVCTQSNAGVRFVYDHSLKTSGYDNIVPVITQAGNSLSYSDDNLIATGYFSAGNAVLTLLDNDIPVNITSTSTQIPLTFMPKELWTITLKAGMTNSSITASVDLNIIEQFLDITIDPGYVPTITVFRESFAKCTGPDYPIAGATFSTSVTFPALTQAAGLTDWTFVSAYTCNQGLKMGVSATNGIATTPKLTAIGATTKTITLTFMAANWETATRGLKVSVIGAGTVSPAGGIITLPAGTPNNGTISEASAMKQYTVVIENATQDTQIVFSPSAETGSNRYFLADITVTTTE